jgi:hypothetical protein
MNFVVATIICSRIAYFPEVNNLPIEELDFSHINQVKCEKEIFFFMMELIQRDGKLGMQGLWGLRVPRLKLRVYQLDR